MACAMDEVFSEFWSSDKLDGFGPVNLLTTSWKCEQVGGDIVGEGGL
jgi:ubiquitin carboxyl-terminal hydrolase 22/27/51